MTHSDSTLLDHSVEGSAFQQQHDNTVRTEIEEFRSKAEDFLAGRITDDDFRPYRLRFGCYGQRQAGVQMMRTKVPGGTLTSVSCPTANFCAATDGKHGSVLTHRSQSGRQPRPATASSPVRAATKSRRLPARHLRRPYR